MAKNGCIIMKSLPNKKKVQCNWFHNTRSDSWICSWFINGLIDRNKDDDDGKLANEWITMTRKRLISIDISHNNDNCFTKWHYVSEATAQSLASVLFVWKKCFECIKPWKRNENLSLLFSEFQIIISHFVIIFLLFYDYFPTVYDFIRFIIWNDRYIERKFSVFVQFVLWLFRVNISTKLSFVFLRSCFSWKFFVKLEIFCCDWNEWPRSEEFVNCVQEYKYLSVIFKN